MNDLEYSYIIVESYIPENKVGHHGLVHIRPCSGQDPFLPSMGVECSKRMMEDYPVGTRFGIKAKITSRQGSDPFVYSHYKWPFDVL